MNRDKENSVKHSTTTRSKEHTNGFKKPTQNEGSKSLNKSVCQEKERKASNTRKSHYVRENNQQADKNRRQTVSPLPSMDNSKQSTNQVPDLNKMKNKKIGEEIITQSKMMKTEAHSVNNAQNVLREVTEANINNINLETTAEVPQENKNTSSNCTSSAKRKFTDFISETNEEKSNFENFEKNINFLYEIYISSNSTWLESFQSAYKSDITVDTQSLLPQTFSTIGSKILTSQKFWIMWIEHIRQTREISIENLTFLFDESFNYIIESPLIKAYYLQTMRGLDLRSVKEYLLLKERILTIDEGMITNEMLFSLLSTFSIFMLSFKVEQGKKKVSSKSKFEVECDQNIQLTLTSKQRQFMNVQVEVKDNVFYNKEDKQVQEESPEEQVNLPQEEVNPLQEENEEKNSKVMDKFVTPKAESKRESCKSKRDLSAVKDTQTNPNWESSEFNDKMCSLVSHTQKTEQMIVSQNTTLKQIEFVINLNNSHNETQCHSINQIVPERGVLEEAESEKAKEEEIVDETFPIREVREEIEDLQEESIALEDNSSVDNSINETAKIITTNINFNSSKRNSNSRSRSRGRINNSIVNEEYPDDLVEGSIRTFNKSFTGNVESCKKSKGKMSSRKGEEEEKAEE